jgi:hypothetical protein
MLMGCATRCSRFYSWLGGIFRFPTASSRKRTRFRVSCTCTPLPLSLSIGYVTIQTLKFIFADELQEKPDNALMLVVSHQVCTLCFKFSSTDRHCGSSPASYSGMPEADHGSQQEWVANWAYSYEERVRDYVTVSLVMATGLKNVVSLCC